jgi:hypothetical protein
MIKEISAGKASQDHEKEAATILENNQTINARLLEAPRVAVDLAVVVEAAVVDLDVLAGLAVLVVEDDVELLDVVDVDDVPVVVVPDDEAVAAEPDDRTIKDRGPVDGRADIPCNIADPRPV